ncbi:hypothetical protein EOB59_28895 [Mesorhizobium sp. M7A.F.Ca.MR.176.00.0.0]|uniref:hypothetical protein n=1 Tax=Mesorhizobium sp. M7A.F.Ca.MR.176.00.0.0 TaxID=2496776 RepID=UPI000FD19A28|nr:hypothetical protein [Mesorhizobium sp. M7A.F.Ca.MR.176.00.0.0]RUU86451.1 hypothetical protein EOB59_28895 [Mesorhizobium sp. M7A.F.Ca.MR.176.00.0.0]
MPNIHVPAVGEAMPSAKPMAAAALRIERDAAFIATAMSLIDGGSDYRVQIDHEVGFVLVVRLS